VRLAGRNPDLVLVEDQVADEEPAPTPGDDLSARITLRLPEALKLQVEVIASSEGVSANAWIVRALARSLEPRRGKTQSGRRLQGFTQS
jgi:HicB family